MTNEQREAAREALLDQLAQRVAKLRTTEGWLEWLEVAKQLHTYSFNNQLLIAIQNPEATMVMGYGKQDGSTGWLKLGRQVRKGEQSIRIYAPVFAYLDADGNRISWKQAKALGITQKRVVAFKLVPVFDVSQTDGDPLPESPGQRWRRLMGEDREGTEQDWNTVVKAAQSLGFDVKVEPPAGKNDPEGWWRPGTKLLHVAEKAWGAMTKTALHELAHALDPANKDASWAARANYHYGQGELVAESVSALVAAELGLTNLEVSTTYLASWDGDDKAIAKLAGRVLGVAKKISTALFDGEVAEAVSDEKVEVSAWRR